MPDRTRPVPAEPSGPEPAVEGPRPGPDTSSRRTLLRAAGLVALAGGGATLAACSAEAEVPAPAPATTAPPPSSAASSASAPASASASKSASASTSATASKPAVVPKGPSVAASEVPVGSGVILDDADYVVTQPTKGEFRAFSKICTHNGCPVSEISGREIVCRCHGSRFSIEDGSVTNPPARKSLAEAEVTLAGGKVVVTG